MNRLEELRKNLYEDVIAFNEEDGLMDFSFLEVGDANANKILYKIARRLTYFFQKIGLYTFKKNKTKKLTVLYYIDQLSYPDIFRILVSHTNVIINNPLRCRPFKLFLKKNVIFLPLSPQERTLKKGLLNNDNILVDRSVCELRSIITKVSPDIIVLNDSALPINRALNLIGRELNIPTVEIQHGLIQEKMPLMRDGLISDYIFLWGDYFKQLYLTRKIRTEESMRVLGYPGEIANNPSVVSDRQIILYYFAQSYEYIDVKNLDILLETTVALRGICEKYGFEFRCRLRPDSSERLINKISPVISCQPATESLDDAIGDGDIFISFNSTALVHAAISRKICVQLRNYPVDTDNFESLGICPSFPNIKSMDQHLKRFSGMKPCNLKDVFKPIAGEYLEIPHPNPGARFLDLIEDLVNNNVD